MENIVDDWEFEQETIAKCAQSYDIDICQNCDFNAWVFTSHPGGSSTASMVEKHHCENGYWEEDF